MKIVLEDLFSRETNFLKISFWWWEIPWLFWRRKFISKTVKNSKEFWTNDLFFKRIENFHRVLDFFFFKKKIKFLEFLFIFFLKRNKWTLKINKIVVYLANWYFQILLTNTFRFKFSLLVIININISTHKKINCSLFGLLDFYYFVLLFKES